MRSDLIRKTRLKFIFQVITSLSITLGPIKVFQLISRFPAIILTPLFSFWTISGVQCCVNGALGQAVNSPDLNVRSDKLLGISFCHSWINAFITLCFSIGGWTFTFLQSKSEVIGYSRIFWGIWDPEYFIVICISIPLFVISALLIILFQFHEKFNKCCCDSCCKIEIEFTLLDMNEMDEIIDLKEREFNNNDF